MRVAVCRPSHGPPFREHQKCLNRLARAFPEWVDLTLAGPCVDIVRSAIAEQALVEKADILLWLDADMTFAPETCRDIVQSAHDLKAIVGCAYVAKRTGSRIQAAFIEYTESVEFYKGGRLYPCEAIGFGVVAMPAAILETIAEHGKLPRQLLDDRAFRAWFSNDPTWDKMHSDDYSFCRRARAAGIPIYCDTRHRVGHIGEYVYMIEDLKERTLYEEFSIREGEDPAERAAE